MGNVEKQASHPSQYAIGAVPTFLVDGHFGIATAMGIARISFGALKFNVTPEADTPILDPVVTIAVSEVALLAFAKEMIDRAAALGITLDNEVTA